MSAESEVTTSERASSESVPPLDWQRDENPEGISLGAVSSESVPEVPSAKELAEWAGELRQLAHDCDASAFVTALTLDTIADYLERRAVSSSPSVRNEQAPKPVRPTPNPGIGMPAALLLDEFGAVVWDAFGEPAYHVGSSLMGKQWRDVDVRLMLDDEAYEAMGLGDPKHTHSNAKWVALVRAFAALGREMTGLPIDFQIQQSTLGNAQYGDGARSALGCHAKIRTGQIK